MALLFLNVFLWITKSIPVCDCGWIRFFKVYADWQDTSVDNVISDATVGFLCGMLMFWIPTRNRNVGMRILEWDGVVRNMPWDIMLLLGGGFALAEAFEDTGFTEFLAHNLTALESLSPILILFIITVAVTVATEFTSNVAIASIVIPVMASTAVALRIDPLFLMVPTAIACSFAFCLPVATPPNALVFGLGILRMKDMIKSGIWMNLFGILLNAAWMLAAGRILGIDRHVFPSWAEP